MSQKQQVLNHLKIHGVITPLEALNYYGVFRLASRINELRNDGELIATIETSQNNKKYATYKLTQGHYELS